MELSEKYAGITEGEEKYTSAPKRWTWPSDINPQNLQLSPGADTPLALNKASTAWMGKGDLSTKNFCSDGTNEWCLLPGSKDPKPHGTVRSASLPVMPDRCSFFGVFKVKLKVNNSFQHKSVESSMRKHQHDDCSHSLSTPSLFLHSMIGTFLT